MGEVAAALPIDAGVAVAVVFTVLLLIARGHLVPGPQHREAIEDRDRQITYLQSAVDKSLTLNSEDAKTIAKLSVVSDVSAHILEEMRRDHAGEST